MICNKNQKRMSIINNSQRPQLFLIIRTKIPITQILINLKRNQKSAPLLLILTDRTKSRNTLIMTSSNNQNSNQSIHKNSKINQTMKSIQTPNLKSLHKTISSIQKLKIPMKRLTSLTTIATNPQLPKTSVTQENH